MTAHRSVDVGLGGDDELAEVIGSAAARLGAVLSVRRAGEGRIVIGDVELPPSPEEWQVEAAILRALRPSHILFLCVANSARSQLGEGIGRSLGGERVRVSSAGSTPTSVRPQAAAVLEEIGIDGSDHRSKGVDQVERPVDAVITLCAEEVCPVWLEDASRLHWPLPDPAAVEGTEDEKIGAFREVRDELFVRLELLLGSA